MEEKMDSEQSYSGESSSSSETSSGSTEGEEEVTEKVQILGHTLELPQELCEDYAVFKEFFSMRTWESLEDKHKERLKEYLPTFPENDEEEKEKTVKMLFNFEPFKFTSPLNDFYSNLRQGNYRPDIAKMRQYLKKARVKQQRHRLKSYYAKLLPEVLVARERLLAAAKGAPPGPIPRLPILPPKPSSKNNYKPLYLRAKQRYFEELAAIRSEVGGEESDDENFPEGPPEQCIRKRRQLHSGLNMDSSVSGTLGGIDASHPTSLECLKSILTAHRLRRQYRDTHPELNTSGISLEDIKQRVALVNGAKRLMFGGPKSDSSIQKLRKGSKKDASQKQARINDAKMSIRKGKEDYYDQVENKPLLLKIKCEPEESDSESSSFVDPVASPKQGKQLIDQADIKQEVIDVSYSANASDTNCTELQSDVVIKQEPEDPMTPMQSTSRIIQPVPIKLEDLDGIDMMALPIEIADDSGDVIKVEPPDPEEGTVVHADESLTETTHANFLSLVRALFPARAAHRASKQQLHARCAAVMKSPIAPLNTWYSLSDDWCAELDSALDFLAGERGPHPDDFVPYLQYIPETQIYQWIGAGRDCDAILGRLCERWLRAVSPGPPSCEAPPPRYPTSWVLRPPTSSEIAEFRAQERKRFSLAPKPFTYLQHGYRSVVGPCARAVAGAGLACGGSLLVTQRPKHASFMALLRDALARLPNGEGTRHDILTMLKMSQWIAPCNDQTLLSAVSSALDRLHSAKRDPIVKYDQRSAMWTYLHRNRSEEDWIKIINSRGRGKAQVPISVPALPLPPTSPLPFSSPGHSRESSHQTPPHGMELEVGSVEEVIDNASDSDVDVDDTSVPSFGSHLSSAQLLMQATQASQAKQSPQVIPPKPKGKLVPTSPQKSKPPVQTKQLGHHSKHSGAASHSKPTALVSQSLKQANLMAQSLKQANLLNQAKANLVQSVKQTNLINQTQKQTNLVAQSSKQMNITNQLPKQTNVVNQVTKQIVAKQSNLSQTKVVNVAKASPSQISVPQLTKPSVVTQSVKQGIVNQLNQAHAQLSKSMPSVVMTPQRSPLIKQRSLQKIDIPQISVPNAVNQPSTSSSTIIQHVPSSSLANKVTPGTRSLLIKPPAIQTTATPIASTHISQVTPTSRRGVVRVLSPATPSSGKSLISPRALLQQNTPTTKKRATVPAPTSVTTVVQSTSAVTTVASSVPTAVTSSVTTRTVQLAGGRTVQLAANQTVHLPGGQAVQLTSGHTLQLSSLQLPTHSVRLPSGQTVQLASPQAVQAVRVSTATVKNPSPRPQQSIVSGKSIQTSHPTVQIPVSTVQLTGQTVQIAGQTVQLAGQSVQLTGHTVKLPSGQSVQVASQNVLTSQSVQLPSGQTVQLASGNMPTMQLTGSGQSVHSGQNMQLGSQTVQIGGQTVQLAGGQTVHLPGGQTLQLSSGQTVQLSSGQTLQLASGQTVQLANQAQKASQIVRSQTPTDKASGSQPIVAKLLTNAQGQMISLEGVVGGSRTLQVSGMRPRAGVRVLSPGARLTRPVLLTSAKPLHNIILQQGDGSSIRVTSTGGASISQTLVISNIGSQTVTTPTTSTPILKLQQTASSASVSTSSGVRSVLMDGQQLKLVGGRHVLARILRPAHPPPQ